MPGAWACPGSENSGPSSSVFPGLFPFSSLLPSPTLSALHPQMCVRLLSSGRPMLYSFQTSLPKLPVPSVPATIQRVRPGSGILLGRVDWNQDLNKREGPSRSKSGFESSGAGGSIGVGQRQPLLSDPHADGNLAG